MHRIRPFLFWTHLVVGLAAGALILLMSVTGVLLGFERQMIAWIDGVPRIERAAGPAEPGGIDTALARAGVATGDVASLLIRRDPTLPVTVRFRDRERAAALLDPSRGALLPAREPGAGQRYFSALRRWHRWVGAQGGELRASMKAATGAANLAFLGLILSGLVLWWPRRWTPARLRTTLVPSVSAHGKARDFNWHHSFGFWSALPLALVVASGVFISYQWPGRLLDRWLGSPEERAAAIAAATRPAEPARGAAAGARADARASTGADRTAGAAAATVPLEPLLAAARAAHPEWQQLTLTLGAPRDSVARVAVAEGNTYRPDLRTTLTLRTADASLVDAQGYDDLSLSRRIRAWVRFGHTGEVFGVVGQLVATLVTGVGAVLVWTGVALSWRRFVAWRGRRRREAPRLVLAGDRAG